MRKLLLITLIFGLFGSASYSQSDIPVQNVSPGNPKHRLFATSNMYTFLELDTATGLIYQVQWGMEPGYRHFTFLNGKSLLPEGEEPKPGRFFLYPTSNIYTFILLDQVSGNTWQVQWSMDAEERMVAPIYLGT